MQLLVSYSLLSLQRLLTRLCSQRLQPTGTLWRRRIKLLIARDAGDGEITRCELRKPLAIPTANLIRL
jgi:hypothetical protein